MNTQPEADFVQRFHDRMHDGKPFSLVRLGDGEMTILRYPEYVAMDAVREQFSRWWKEPVVTKADAELLRTEMLAAFQNADMLGVAHDGEQLRYPKWNLGKRFDDMMRELHLPGSRSTDVFYFYHIVNLNDSGMLDEVLRGKRIRLITCRPECGAYVQKRFQAKEVQVQLIRAEAFRWKPYASLDAAAEASASAPPHWPTGYRETVKWICDGGSGWVYLIGAGGPGKVYAEEARRAGSVGLDIGALLDGWGGHPTRPYLEGMRR